MEKIAIHCPTQELFDAVCKKLDEKHFLRPYHWEKYKDETCISSYRGWGYDNKEWHERNGYTITPAAEWLAQNAPGEVENTPRNLEGVQVGDRVWSLDRGWGKVERICLDYKNSIMVRFTHVGISYTIDGREDSCFLNPSLFFDEIQLPPYPKRPAPKWEPKRGEPVLVWDFDSYNPRPRIFSHMKGESYCVVSDTPGYTPYRFAKPFTLPETPEA